jgi:hypothetical protein
MCEIGFENCLETPHETFRNDIEALALPANPFREWFLFGRVHLTARQ